MTPTLSGRIQTRLFLLATVGLAWTVVVMPVIPRFGASLAAAYGTAVLALVLVGVLGIGWEVLYHGIQQYRWEKDWPILLGLLTAFPEFLLVAAVLLLLVPGASVVTVFLHFFSTWIVMWLVANGPLRILLLRWRYRGGRIL